MILESIFCCCPPRSRRTPPMNPYPLPRTSDSDDIYAITNREPSASLSLHAYENPIQTRKASLPDALVAHSEEFWRVESPGPSVSTPNLYEVPDRSSKNRLRVETDDEFDSVTLDSGLSDSRYSTSDEVPESSNHSNSDNAQTDEFYDCKETSSEKNDKGDDFLEKPVLIPPAIVISSASDDESRETEGFSPSRPVPPLPNSSQKSPTQEPYAVTLYPFQGSQFDELTCETGDKIVLKREVDDQWIYGMNMRTGQHGIVPLGYLEVRIPLAPTTSSAPSAHALPPNTTCALYDYLTGVDGDLQFRSGDRITVLEYVNADWLKGESAGKTGIFPANYVDTTSLTLAPPKQPVQSAAQETGETITVAFDYNSGVADDLVCRAGDVISVIERVNSDWIKGRLNGKEGLVPTTYLQKSSSIASIGKALKEMSLEMTAIADYSPSEPGHMEISRGDKVTVLEDVDEYWYKARLSDRAFRFIPPAFVPKNILQ